MSESIQHRALVSRIVNKVHEQLHGDYKLVCLSDLGDGCGEVPPLVNGFRPDVMAYGQEVCFLGEAKPPSDVESRRTERQLRAFMSFVEERECRHLMFSVHWSSAPLARAVLKSVASNWRATSNRVHVLDGVRQVCIRREHSG